MIRILRVFLRIIISPLAIVMFAFTFLCIGVLAAVDFCFYYGKNLKTYKYAFEDELEEVRRILKEFFK